MADIFKGRTALVTGSSSGIGYELTRLLLKRGAEVVMTAGDKVKLDRVASDLSSINGRKPVIIARDLSDPKAPQQIVDELASQRISIDILVNNAGFGVYGPFHNTDLNKSLQLIDVNVKAPVALTRLLLPGMMVRGFGRILNVASTAAFQPIPIESVYAASKSFILWFSEGIAEELKGTGVGVTCLCPGPTETPFFERGEFRQSRTIRRFKMPANKVAEIGLNALAKNKPLVVAGLSNRLGAFLVRFFPRTWVTKIARKVVE